jgi:hypothetical protein
MGSVALTQTSDEKILPLIPLNKLAPYNIHYKCMDDCQPQGCPGHVASFRYNSSSDSFVVGFSFREREIHLDAMEVGLIADFINKLKE